MNVHKQINDLERLLSNDEFIFKRKLESKMFMLLDLLIATQSWLKIVDWSSKLILATVPINVEKKLYYYWINALSEMNACSGLTDLGRHLAKKPFNKYLDLSLLCFTLAQKKELSGKVYDRLLKIKSSSDLFKIEACALYKELVEPSTKKEIGTMGYEFIMHSKNSCYPMLRNALKFFSNTPDADLNLKSKSKQVLSVISRKFRFSKEPKFAKALSFVQKQKWSQACHALKKIISMDSKDLVAVMAFSECLEVLGQNSKNIQLLLKNTKVPNMNEYHLHCALFRNYMAIYNKKPDYTYLKNAKKHQSLAKKYFESHLGVRDGSTAQVELIHGHTTINGQRLTGDVSSSRAR